MKLHHLATLVFSLFLTLCFIPNAFAQAGKSGMDVRMGLGANALYFDLNTDLQAGSLGINMDRSSEDWLAGVAGQISVGYRWHYFGVYFDQDLTGIWETGEAASDASYFLGGSFITVRGILPIRDRLQLDLGIGLGVLYGAETEKTASLVVNDKNEPTAIFGLKGSFYLTYYITPAFGLGLHLDYLFGVNKYVSEFGILGQNIKTDITIYYHNLLPGLHAMLRF